MSDEFKERIKQEAIDPEEEMMRKQEDEIFRLLEEHANAEMQKAEERKLAENIKYFEDVLKEQEERRAAKENPENKRDLKKSFKKLHNKVYKLSEKTKEKVIKVKDYLKKNGKKVVGFIAVLALTTGFVAHEVSVDKKGYETYNEYGSAEQIEQRIDDVLTNEIAKALNNKNIRVSTEKCIVAVDGPYDYQITVYDTNSEEEMTFVVGIMELSNPNYIRKIVKEYEKVKPISRKEKDGRISGTIKKIKAGKALNEVEELAQENDVIIKKGSITGKLNMDRVPERVVDDDNER